jgi:FkbM family methyltransferase
MTRWHADLKQNRQCTIDERCVWTKTGEKLVFLEVESGELSTIASYADSDLHSEARKQSNHITVDTVSLADLLMQHNAPNVIDYLSVDTEGSELDILSVFPFDDYKFNFISIEHNYTDNREKIKTLLHENGYKNVLPGLSKWDDWFVPKG